MYEHLTERLGYRFNHPELVQLALMHPSARYERSLPDDNQRLEYLGDAALGLAAADYLYRHFPEQPEGRLTTQRSRITSSNALAEIGRELDLGASLVLGRGEEQSGGRNKDKNLADAVEAVIGAVYLDGGMEAVAGLFQRLFAPRLEPSAPASSPENFKGQLQEWAQKAGLPCPEYEVEESSGPEHQPTFRVRVRISETQTAMGIGPTKRAAEQAAAGNLLASIGTGGPSSTGTNAD